jgi:hypothetical protein
MKDVKISMSRKFRHLAIVKSELFLCTKTGEHKITYQLPAKDL